MAISELLVWFSMALSAATLALTLVAWRRIEARMRDEEAVQAEEVDVLRRLLAFEAPRDALRDAGRPAKASAGRREEFPLAKRISEFSQALGRWCEAAGDKPMGVAMKDRRPRLEGLVREAMSERTTRSAVEMQFAKAAAEIVMAAVSATDKDFIDDPRREELELQVMVLVAGAGLGLIDPAPGTALDRDRHESRGGRGSGGEGRETVAAVLSRGVERPSAAKGSRERVLRKAEVTVNY